MTKNKKSRLIRFPLGFVVLLSFIMLLFGVAIGKYKTAGYPIFSGAFEAAEAVKVCLDLKLLSEESSHHISAPYEKAGLIRRDVEKMQPGLTFFSFFNEGEYQLGLLDEAGTMVHKWRVPYDKVKGFAYRNPCSLTKTNLFIHGAHLYPNGDVLISFEFQGIIKLDKNSELIWQLDIPSHHSLAVADDGTIWSLSRHVDIESERVKIFDESFYQEDHLLKVSSDGKVLAEYSLLDLFFANGYQGLLMVGHNEYRYANTDPLHTNDVKLLSPSQAARFPGAKAGDLLISMRAISTLMVISLDTQQVLWSKTGPFMRQHDPEIDSDGVLWVFDNRNATPQKNDGVKYLPEGQVFGGSRIVALPLGFQTPVWEFQGTPEEPFFTSIMGRLQVLDNGNVLVVEPEGGRLFEITVPEGEVVWEYRNLVKPGTVGRVSDGDRYARSDLQFLTP